MKLMIAIKEEETGLVACAMYAFTYFFRAMLRRSWYWYNKLSVRPYSDHIGRSTAGSSLEARTVIWNF